MLSLSLTLSRSRSLARILHLLFRCFFLSLFYTPAYFLANSLALSLCLSFSHTFSHTFSVCQLNNFSLIVSWIVILLRNRYGKREKSHGNQSPNMYKTNECKLENCSSVNGLISQYLY